MEAVVAILAALDHPMDLAVPNTATVARPRPTVGLAANQPLEHVEAAPPTLQLRSPSRSARTRHAVPEPRTLAKDQVMAIAVHNMVIAEVLVTTAGWAVKQALDLADSLQVQFIQTRCQAVR